MHIPSAAEFRFAYIDRMQDLLNFCFAILNPITRPDPMNLPSKSFKDLLAQTVTVTRGHGGIIHRAVTFDSKQKASRIIRIDNGEVDTILSIRMMRDAFCLEDRQSTRLNSSH